MAIECVHTYLVHPGKSSSEQVEIKESTLQLSGKLYDLLSKIYDNAENECNIQITFIPKDGKQENECRDLLASYAAKPTPAKGRKIAERLRANSDKRSGVGLLFLIKGTETKKHKLLVARFPTDTGVLADETDETLTVTFLERIFMRSSKAYKAVFYEDATPDTGYWVGRAVDRQMNDLSETSQYWITDFLMSSLSVTPARGTLRLAKAMKTALKLTSDDSVRAELIALAKMLEGQKGKTSSIDDIIEKFDLSDNAAYQIREQLAPGVSGEKFKFDLDEFKSHISYRTIELDNGAVLTADASSFDEVFEQHEGKSGSVSFSTQGKIVNESFRKTR